MVYDTTHNSILRALSLSLTVSFPPLSPSHASRCPRPRLGFRAALAPLSALARDARYFNSYRSGGPLLSSLSASERRKNQASVPSRTRYSATRGRLRSEIAFLARALRSFEPSDRYFSGFIQDPRIIPGLLGRRPKHARVLSHRVTRCDRYNGCIRGKEILRESVKDVARVIEFGATIGPRDGKLPHHRR